jgi:predicted small secreted protein
VEFDGDDTMKTTLALCTAVAVTTLLLGGCADHGYAQGVGPGPDPDALAMADCDGFYDDFYGPFDDGCWGDDGGFWYRGHDGNYHRDHGGHFSHTVGGGMHSVHGIGPGAGAHFGGGGHMGGGGGGGRR